MTDKQRVFELTEENEYLRKSLAAYKKVYLLQKEKIIKAVSLLASAPEEQSSKTT